MENKPKSQCLTNNICLPPVGVSRGFCSTWSRREPGFGMSCGGETTGGPLTGSSTCQLRMTHEPLRAHPADRAPALHLSARGLAPVEEGLGGSDTIYASDHVTGDGRNEGSSHASSPDFLPSTTCPCTISDPQGIRPRWPLNLQMGTLRPRGLAIGSGCIGSGP